MIRFRKENLPNNKKFKIQAIEQGDQVDLLTASPFSEFLLEKQNGSDFCKEILLHLLY